jgi:hypothetical protein
MKNRAKCKLCGDIIESLHVHDYVSCKCGEIAVDGGLQYLKAIARDWKNFLRVDDLGNEIEITIQEKEPSPKEDIRLPPPTREELMTMLDDFLKRIEELPPGAGVAPVTHYDMMSFGLILSALFRSFDKS